MLRQASHQSSLQSYFFCPRFNDFIPKLSSLSESPEMFNTLSAFVLALATSVSSSHLTSRDDLQPWQVTETGYFSPSGRPESYPWLTITINLTDPNELVLGTSPSDGSPVTVPAGNNATNCQAKWYTYTKPFHHIWPCDATDNGYWLLELPGTETTFRPASLS